MRSLPACSRRRVRQVAVGKACVPYFRGAEVAITRNAVDQRYVEQKRFRERCANELAVRKACSFQRGFLQVCSNSRSAPKRSR